MASRVQVDVRFDGQENLSPAFNRVKQGAEALENSVARANVSMRNIGGAVSTVAGQLTGLQGIAGLASNAILGLATATGPVSIAFAALTATVGLFVYRIEQARDRLRELAEIELNQLARETKALDLENTVK